MTQNGVHFNTDSNAFSGWKLCLWGKRWQSWQSLPRLCRKPSLPFFRSTTCDLTRSLSPWWAQPSVHTVPFPAKITHQQPCGVFFLNGIFHWPGFLIMGSTNNAKSKWYSADLVQFRVLFYLDILLLFQWCHVMLPELTFGRPFCALPTWRRKLTGLWTLDGWFQRKHPVDRALTSFPFFVCVTEWKWGDLKHEHEGDISG